MTMIVTVLSPHYALVMADTKSTVRGPAAFDVGNGRMVTVTEEQQAVWEGSPFKVTISPDDTDALAFSGNRNLEEPFLGITDPSLRGIRLDDHIAAWFERHAAHEEHLHSAFGSQETRGGLHVYRSGPRAFATRFTSWQGAYSRRMFRSNPERLVWAAIGSGDRALEKLHGTEWDSFALQPDRFGIEDVAWVRQFWGRLFAYASVALTDVNRQVVSHLLPLDGASRWVMLGRQDFDESGLMVNEIKCDPVNGAVDKEWHATLAFGAKQQEDDSDESNENLSESLDREERQFHGGPPTSKSV